MNTQLSVNGSHSESKSPILEFSRFQILKFLIWIIIVGIIFIFIYCFRFFWGDQNSANNFISILYIAAIGVMVAGASLMIGAFAGFLFAIPKILTSNNSNQALSATTVYTHNDNLVQISDWLTKIMVGVGLTQLIHLPEVLKQLGEYLQSGFGNDLIAQCFSITIVLYFLTNGFLLSYLWTRLYFIRMLAETDQDIENTRRMYEREKKEKEELKDIIKVSGFNQDLKKVKLPEYDSEDPQKGKWGGQPESNGKKITAFVTPGDLANGLFKINLQVKSTDPNNTLTGRVKFYLHPTYQNSEPEVVSKNGIAELNLVAYGAFTVGARTEDGTTLELDLAQIPEAPEVFKNR
jgi:hypothetical protein